MAIVNPGIDRHTTVVIGFVKSVNLSLSSPTVGVLVALARCIILLSAPIKTSAFAISPTISRRYIQLLTEAGEQLV